ncbi:MAG TPA: UDP-glucose 4-epimerase, partial [Casimicrobiaceae bacterium]|nr:UDP-glucose 4-epimerase [Casimicrobiaceae bacterium]
HVAALKYLERNAGVATMNLGIGRGFSVLEVVDAFEKACGRRLTRQFVDRRDGDIACVYADPSRAETSLGWRASRSLEVICEDAWRWQQRGGRYG